MPRTTDGCDAAELRLFPDGQIIFRRGTKGVVAGSVCLDNYVGEPSSWRITKGDGSPSTVIVRIASLGHSEAVCFPMDPTKTFALPTFSAPGSLQLDVFASPSSPDDEARSKQQWQPAVDAAQKDPVVAAALIAAQKKSAATANQEFAQQIKSFTDMSDASYGTSPQPVFRGVVPAVNDSTTLVAVEAWSGASTIPGLHDGDALRVFAFDLDSASPQDVEVVKGAAIDNSSLLTPFVQAFQLLGVGLKAAQFQDLSDALQAAVLARLKPSARYTSRVVSATVDGGYQYNAEVCLPSTKGSDAGAPASPTGSKACTGASQDQITASAAFRVPAHHQIVSAAVELGWNFSANGFPSTGYQYQPISQGGPDQLYQLQGVNHPSDQVTSSALLLFYPVALTTASWCAMDKPRIFCPTDGVAIGFGPTFLRGSSGELFKQWNLRLLVEIASGVLVSLGPSWREFDIPQGSLEQVVSVPKPGSPPTSATYSAWNPMFTLGLSLDLSLLGNAVSSVAAAASPSAATTGSGSNGGAK